MTAKLIDLEDQDADQLRALVTKVNTNLREAEVDDDADYIVPLMSGLVKYLVEECLGETYEAVPALASDNEEDDAMSSLSSLDEFDF